MDKKVVPYRPPAETANQFGMHLQGHVIRNMFPLECYSRQSAYRAAAWLVTMAEVLPNETIDSTWEEVLHAIRNT